MTEDVFPPKAQRTRRRRAMALSGRFLATFPLPLLGRTVPSMIGSRLPRGTAWWPVDGGYECDWSFTLVLATLGLGLGLMVAIAAGAETALSAFLRSVGAFVAFLFLFAVSAQPFEGLGCTKDMQACTVFALTVLLAVAWIHWWEKNKGNT